ncbi:MAG: hypothetical protein KBS82_03345 [Oscillospiraceae bacterium]|nr:hypothetical protein [Candidatus Limimonas egerieequi]
MPLLQNGVYVENSDKPYELETVYYLNFHILSALFSIERLYSFETNEIWNNKVQYYHYYADHLLFCVGQIANRFVDGNSKKSLLERKRINRGNFNFTDEKYPILSNKSARNVIEHIDERNQKIIANKQGVGGFNIIDDATSLELTKTLRERTDSHPYTLDLIKKELLIRDNESDLVINIDYLKQELELLHKSVIYFEQIITDLF